MNFVKTTLFSTVALGLVACGGTNAPEGRDGSSLIADQSEAHDEERETLSPEPTRPEINCGTGTVLVHDECVVDPRSVEESEPALQPEPEVVCGAGTTLRNGVCIADAPSQPTETVVSEPTSTTVEELRADHFIQYCQGLLDCGYMQNKSVAECTNALWDEAALLSQDTGCSSALYQFGEYTKCVGQDTCANIAIFNETGEVPLNCLEEEALVEQGFDICLPEGVENRFTRWGIGAGGDINLGVGGSVGVGVGWDSEEGLQISMTPSYGVSTEASKAILDYCYVHSFCAAIGENDNPNVQRPGRCVMEKSAVARAFEETECQAYTEAQIAYDNCRSVAGCNSINQAFADEICMAERQERQEQEILCTVQSIFN